MSSLPDVLQVKPLPTIDTMKIDTQVLDPITITESQAVFQIPMNGILDGGSYLQLGAKCAAGVTDCFFPIATGVSALIENVQLKIGGQVVSSTEDFGHYNTMMRQFQTPEHRAFVGMVKEGATGDRFATNEGSAGGNTAGGRVGYRDLAYNDGAAAAEVPNFVRLTSDDATTPLFSLPLSTLIPMLLKLVMLPVLVCLNLPLMLVRLLVFLRPTLNLFRTICITPMKQWTRLPPPSLPRVVLPSSMRI